MKIKSLFLFAILFSLIRCGTNTQKTSEPEVKKEDIKTEQAPNPKGLTLMQQKCFICHFKTPDPERHDQMIAPPMQRIQEHYLPNYPKKEDFVQAILEWTKNPTEEKTLMPGTIRKFKIMPKLGYTDEDVKIIAEYLYDMNFGATPKMEDHDTALKLNNDKKWKLNKETMNIVQGVSQKLNSFESKDINAYNQLGKDVFDSAKSILVGDKYDDPIFNQLQNFFHKIEGNMHQLIAAKSIDDAQKEVNSLKNKFDSFGQFFE